LFKQGYAVRQGCPLQGNV